MIDIAGLERWEVVAALYDDARVAGMGSLVAAMAGDAPLTRMEAIALLIVQDEEELGRLDYVKGRVIKTRIPKTLGGHAWLDPRLYDRDNGVGAAARAIARVRSRTR